MEWAAEGALAEGLDELGGARVATRRVGRAAPHQLRKVERRARGELLGGVHVLFREDRRDAARLGVVVETEDLLFRRESRGGGRRTPAQIATGVVVFAGGDAR